MVEYKTAHDWLAIGELQISYREHLKGKGRYSAVEHIDIEQGERHDRGPMLKVVVEGVARVYKADSEFLRERGWYISGITASADGAEYTTLWLRPWECDAQ
jgi:hypothetical protein